MRRTSDTVAELWRQKCMEKEATQSGDFTIEGDVKRDYDAEALAQEQRADALSRRLEAVMARKKAIIEDAERARQKFIADNGTTPEESPLKMYLPPDYDSLCEEERELSDTMSRARYEAARLRKEKDHAYSELRTEEEAKKDFMKKKLKPAIVRGCYVLLLIHMALTVVLYMAAVGRLHMAYIPRNPAYIFFWAAAPYVLWIWSLFYTDFQYLNIKYRNLYLSCGNFCLMAMAQLAVLAFGIFGPLVFKIPTNSQITPTNVAALAMFVTVFFSLVPAGIMAACFWRFLTDPIVEEKINYYKPLRGKDLRKDVEYAFDTGVVKDFKTGKTHWVKQQDRFLHTVVDGATGTGKTSSIFTPAIQQDLDQTCYNMDHQKLACIELLKEGKLRLKREFTDYDFRTENFEPVWSGDEKEDKALKKRWKYICETMTPAGIMVCAPNEGFADEIYDLTKKRGLRVYRVDPIRAEDGGHKEGWVGFNPLYVSPLITGIDRVDEISVRAEIVKDILNDLNKQRGSVDTYFEGVNSVQTTTSCKLLMLTHEKLYGVQPTLIDVQRVLNDFSEMRKYYYVLLKYYGNNGGYVEDLEELWDTDKYNETDATRIVNSRVFNCGLWHDVYITLKNELLDEKEGPVQYDRARGLRDQYNLFLGTPRVRAIFEAQETLDMDKVLAEGGVIIFNYAIKLGQATSSALGEFFLISYSKAVLRRPSHKFLLPFFTYIDEFPTLLNKDLEELFSLHRQYRSANHVAIQTYEQFEKTPMTKYFKHVLMQNCGHQYLFGRLSITEMRDFEGLAGTELKAEEQRGHTESSLLAPTAASTWQVRTTYKQDKYMLGSDMRYNDFQELTVFTVDDGSPVRPFKAKADFLSDYEKLSPKRVQVDWSRWFYTIPAEYYEARREAAAAAAVPGRVIYAREIQKPAGSGLMFGADGVCPPAKPYDQRSIPGVQPEEPVRIPRTPLAVNYAAPPDDMGLDLESLVPDERRKTRRKSAG